MSTLEVDFVRTRPRAVAFFAGRAWYAGVEANNKNGWVLFSQVANTTDRLEKCYQDNDPTSEIFSDIKDDDGGVIAIPDAGDILALKALGTSLLVFANNGVWSIRGGDAGFKATEYIVEKLTSVGATSSKAIVEVDEVLMYMAPNAIYILKVDQVGIAQAQSATENTIKTYYQSIPLLCKQNAVATYNRTDKIVYFMYSNEAVHLNTYGKFFKNTLLKFDVTIGCFYIETLPTSYPHIVSGANTTEVFTSTQTFDVYVVDDQVVSNGLEVVTDSEIPDSASSKIKFLTAYEEGSFVKLAFSEYRNVRTSFEDWNVSEEDAYVVTGYNMGGVGPVRYKTAPFITVFAKKTETFLDNTFTPTNESSILMQTRWDFTDNSFPGKWSTEYEVYRQLRPYYVSSPGTIQDGYPLVITKNKVRGRGRGLQIKWQAGTNKDMKLVGWSINFVGNQNV